jgi:SAM-dependent methyltransferase
MQPAQMEKVQRLMHFADRSVWSTAAMVMVLGSSGSADQLRAAQELVTALDIVAPEDAGPFDRSSAAAQWAAPLLQAAALVRGDAELWESQSDEALLAQGRASAQAAPLLAQYVFPALSGLTEALARPGARMLDVGTGVGALAVGYAEFYPELTVVGVDVLPRVLALAASTVAASRVADRVILREQDVSTLDEQLTYTLAWLPAPFVPESAVREGLLRISRALVPGGWVVIGHGKFTGDPVDEAVTRFKTVAFGGTALDDGQAQQLLSDAGFVDVCTVPTLAAAPSITAGRRPGS